ncbi:hypothetical protein [Prescottella equi]
MTPKSRLLLAKRIVEDGWPIVRAAEHFDVSWPTTKRWGRALPGDGTGRDG